MEVKFTGSLSDIRSEMEEFLGGSAEGGTAKPAKGGKAAKAPAKPEKVTLDVIREKMLACDDKEGKKKLLGDYDASKLSELPEDRYEEFLADLEKL